jgi:futalosine hydrolase
MRQHLVLVPTESESRIIEPLVRAGGSGSFCLHLCGFGPVVAAARTALLIAEHRPERVLLVGIAGRLSNRLAIGGAYAFERVACHGVGAGSGDAFAPAEALGWPQWPGDGADSATRIGDEISFASGRLPDSAARAGLLLSACAASADEADVCSRRQLFPDAAAEDMEGFAVAAACRLAGVPLDIVRGISNAAGDRDASGWQIEAACRAAAELAVALLGAPA